MKRVARVYAAACGLAFVLATTLASSQALAFALAKNAAGVCSTTYKTAAGVACGPPTVGAGAAFGCITAGAAGATNAAGTSNVTITWASTGTGKYQWAAAGACSPSPAACVYECSAKAQVAESPTETTQLAEVNTADSDIDALFAASGTSAVQAAAQQVVTDLEALPVGPSFTAAQRTAAVSELQSLSTTSVEPSNVPNTEAADTDFNADLVTDFPDLFVPVTTPAMGGVEMCFLAALMALGGAWLARKSSSASHGV
jgi:hypothetical protein